MNIFLLNTISSGKLLTDILVSITDIKGIIGLEKTANAKPNEYYDYSEFCNKHKLLFVNAKTYSLSSKEDKDVIDDQDIDLIIVAGWQRLIPAWLINKCTIGIIGAHGSHEGITRGRGRSPQNWALLTGQKHFIFSIFWIEDGVDNGRVIDTSEYEYDITDDIMSSYIKLSMAMAQMIVKNLNNGRIIKKYGQIQSEEAFYLPQRIREDGAIDWKRDALQIYNLIRALSSPYPGAYTKWKEQEFVIETAIPIINENYVLFNQYVVGEVISIIDKSILVKCKTNLLLIKECSNKAKLFEGMVFESADYNKQIQTIIDRHNERFGTPLSRLVLDEIEIE